MIQTSDILAEGLYEITFDWPIFFSQLFGFAVIIFVIVKYVVPLVKPIMAKAQANIQHQLEESEKAADRLAQAKQAYDSALAEAQAELERLREDARVDAEHIIAKMREAAAAEVARVRRQGRDQVVLFRKQVIRQMQSDLTATVLARTEQKVREQVQSPQTKAESIEKVLNDLEVMAHTTPAVRSRAQWN